MTSFNDNFQPQTLTRVESFFRRGCTVKRDVYDNLIDEAMADIHRIMNPKPGKWHHIGYRQGRRVFMTESALRRCDIDDICSDPLLRPIDHRRSRGIRPNRRPPLSDSPWYELVCWLGKSLLEMMSGQRR